MQVMLYKENICIYVFCINEGKVMFKILNQVILVQYKKEEVKGCMLQLKEDECEFELGIYFLRRKKLCMYL